MNLLKEFSLSDKCSYLHDKEQTTHYKLIHSCDIAYNQNLVERGFRRFGKMYFRPVCDSCQECQSIKIDVVNFEFSKSQRRVMKKATAINSFIQTPTMTQAHLDLFTKYHLFMKEKKGWEYQDTSHEHYYNSFVSGYNDFGYEVLYYDKHRLIGVDLIDILPDGISSIYFYYDPEYTDYSLGKLSLYNQIKFAKRSNKKWIYLGYYVEDCPSLAYKSHYKPYMTLKGKPSENEDFEWN